MDFRRAEAPDCPELAALMSDALSGYPIYTAAQEYLKPGVDSREMLMSINRTLCNFFMRYNKACFIALDEGNIAGEIMLEAPGEAEFNKRTATLCGGLDTLKFMKVKAARECTPILITPEVSKNMRGPEDLYILNIAVHELWRGQGLARRLVFDCAVPYARKKGCKRLTLVVNTEKHAVMFRHMGFELLDRHDVDFAGKRIPYYLMAMKIDNPNEKQV